MVIELAPVFAPNHVANIQALAREGYWDGLAAIRVNDNSWCSLRTLTPKTLPGDERSSG